MAVTMPETSTAAATLHYVYDPLCGWCYAAARLLAAASALPGLALSLHAGGMLSGANRRPIDAAWRDYVMPHDRRIAQLSGQPFGDAYFDGLLRDHSVVLDSTPPITAILAADALGGRGHDLLPRLQRAHFVEGSRIADTAVLQSLASDIGLERDTFAATFAQLSGDATARHIQESRTLLAELRGHGFPTFALQRDEGWETLDIAPYLGRPAIWSAYLSERIG
jgi:putative protein-disulfide isomerase